MSGFGQIVSVASRFGHDRRFCLPHYIRRMSARGTSGMRSSGTRGDKLRLPSVI